MKKLLSVVLTMCLLLCLAACSTDQEQKQYEQKFDITGEWLAPSMNAAVTFNQDGTGELSLNGTYAATWQFNSSTGKYMVRADKEYVMTAGLEYSMPYINIDGVDFYKMDDYDKAFTLMISRRCEDIIELSVDKTEINPERVYDLSNGVTIQFTGIAASKTEENDSVEIQYLIVNERLDPISEPMKLQIKTHYYLADYPDAIQETHQITLSDTVEGGSVHTGTFRIPLREKIDKTILRYSMLVGGLYFEMYGQQYFLNLSFMAK